MAAGELQRLFPGTSDVDDETGANLAPLTLGEAAALERALQGVEPDSGEAVYRLLTIAARLSARRARGLRRDQAVRLIGLIQARNPEFFRTPSEDVGDGEQGGENGALGWFDAAQRLISHGHRLPDIAGYTVDQAKGFLEAIQRAEQREGKERFAAQLIATRMGVFSDQAAIETAIKGDAS